MHILPAGDVGIWKSVSLYAMGYRAELGLVWEVILKQWRSGGRYFYDDGGLCRQDRVCMKWPLVIGEDRGLGKAGQFSSDSDDTWYCLKPPFGPVQSYLRGKVIGLLLLISSVCLSCCIEVMITNSRRALTVPECRVGVISFDLQGNTECRYMSSSSPFHRESMC